MKKIILFLFLLSMLTAQAQVLRVGPKVGVLGSSTLHDEASMKEQYRSIPALAFQTGGVLNVKVTDLFSLHSELMYVHTRKHIEHKQAGDWQKETYRMLSLPALLRVSFPMGHSEVYANAGPNVSYWLSGKGAVFHPEVNEFGVDVLKYEIAFSGEVNNFRYIIEEPNRFQLGLDLGVGTILPLGPNFLMVDLRYSLGHTNMVKNNNPYIPLPFYNADLRHSQQVLSLSVAYLFDFDIYKLKTKGRSTGKKKE